MGEPGPEQMEQLLVSSDGAVSSGDAQVQALSQALADCYPLPASFDGLLPYAESRERLREALWQLVIHGAAQLHTYNFPCEESGTARPRASRLARFEAGTSHPVTNAFHNIVKLDDIGRSLLLLLDGTRDHAAIVRDPAAEADALPVEEN